MNSEKTDIFLLTGAICKNMSAFKVFVASWYATEQVIQQGQWNIEICVFYQTVHLNVNIPGLPIPILTLEDNLIAMKF